MSWTLNSIRSKLDGSRAWKVWMWVIVVCMAILTVAGLGTNLRGTHDARAAAPKNEVIATVAGMDIKRDEYNTLMDNFRNQYRRAVDPSQSADLHASLLAKLATTKLEVEEAKKSGVVVSAADLAKAREDILTQDKVRETLGLKPTATIADVDAALEHNNQASIEERLPDADLTQSLYVTKLHTLKDSRIVATELDARDSFKQWHTRHILIMVGKHTDEQAKAQAQQVLAKAKLPGADFAALAKQYSEDQGTKAKGGDDGWIDDNTSYVPEFKEAAFALKAGEVTPELVKSPQYGYFIIKAEAIRENLPKDFDKNKAQYISQVEDKRKQAAQKTDNDRLTAEAKQMTIKDPGLRADQAMVDAKDIKDIPQREAKYRAALADYAVALKSTSASSDTASINAQMGSAYEKLHQIPDAVTAYKAVLKSSSSPAIEVALANIYLDQKNNADALTNLQAAAKEAWDDPSIHQQVMAGYRRLDRKDLVAQEVTWQQDFQKKQQAAQEEMMKQFAVQTPKDGKGQPTVQMMPAGGGPPPGAQTANAPAANVPVASSPGAPPPQQMFKVVMPKKGGKPIVTPMPASSVPAQPGAKPVQ